MHIETIKWYHQKITEGKFQVYLAEEISSGITSVYLESRRYELDGMRTKNARFYISERRSYKNYRKSR